MTRLLSFSSRTMPMSMHKTKDLRQHLYWHHLRAMEALSSFCWTMALTSMHKAKAMPQRSTWRHQRGTRRLFGLF
ncbi:hypothetical protein FOIG_16974 [Fusarium odoratissimum NRRL 54006]|uniref:Uncharacterized protein n=1 Tax=Fusarium odoratissimum (strain NRRL 54006) TaxID=1089451 RepID=X0J067_FUSO5|nr:uncharacterized protein FOIG_16974 [Fusarium odoratissimum NRRL 54006]EXL89741.1 hypothetical protein FOIG_16974 [Fusarium odoratissimum NRRL 54006]